MNWDKTIFLAHASEDKPFVRHLYKKLKDNGLEPWLDEESIPPGVQWDVEIKNAIKKSRIFIGCFSHNSVSKSGYIQKELRLALQELERKAPNVIYFIPALIEDISLPYITVGTIQLRDYKAIKIFNEAGLQKLIDYLKEQINVVQEVKNKENPLFQKLRESIAEGQTEDALKLLKEYAQSRDSYLTNDVVLLTSRYNKVRKENLMGTISGEQYSLENNKIVYALLETIKIMEGKEKK